MISVEKSRVVNADTETLWGLIDDLDSLAQWFEFGDRFEILEGAGVGRRQRMHGTWGKKRSEIDQRVVEYEPGALLGWVHEAERLDGKPAPRFAASTHFTIRLVPTTSGTRVTLCSDQEPASGLRGVIMRLFGTRDIAKSLEKSLTRLAQRVET